ncbi:MAG TPA: 4-alpha-glucanotransferase [Opitutaceae bacterium]|nr:4-alpha-glucanotransferase [Opitutaceae bacterium]
MSPKNAPLFNWLEGRAAGVLLHPTAFPGPHGVGTLDRHAARFLEFLARAGFSYWQVCPLGSTGYGNSPYQSFSAFAGNPYLIDLEPLIAAGLLARTDLAKLEALPADRVDFGGIWQHKWPVLFAAAERFQKALGQQKAPELPYGDFTEFCASQAAWLGDYALFLALKDHFGGRPWWEWPADSRTYEKAVKSQLRRTLAPKVFAHQFLQYVFFGQWRALRQQANAHGIQIIGDVPIFVALDSADAWANSDLFLLDPNTRRPTFVAGVPPDYFSADGQLWGNPLYDWPAHQRTRYVWWMRRLAAAFELCDVVRIDHFRGFESYWAVPAGSPNARKGTWELGPGLDFFRAVREAFPRARIIAEDLGVLTPEVLALREATGLPGMAITQFAFGGDAKNLYLPHNHTPNCVLYPGTHDNDTTRGWYAAAPEQVRDHLRRYFRISGQEISWDFIRAAYVSPCRLAILPLQDLMNLDCTARFNTPGTAEGNWEWRYRPAQLDALERDSAAYLRELGELYGRLPEAVPARAAVKAGPPVV